ncbi:hypothetical protein D3C77_584360 [compost metagenome]
MNQAAQVLHYSRLVHLGLQPDACRRSPLVGKRVRQRAVRSYWHQHWANRYQSAVRRLLIQRLKGRTASKFKQTARQIVDQGTVQQQISLIHGFSSESFWHTAQRGAAC